MILLQLKHRLTVIDLSEKRFFKMYRCFRSGPVVAENPLSSHEATYSDS